VAHGQVGIRPIGTTPRSEILARPFQEFTRIEASGGILLVAATVVALVWANSSRSDLYFDLLHVDLSIYLGQHGLSMSLQHWVNDGLMAVFFFVVGMEIKREVLVGELSELRKAMLPVAAAIGGVLVPAGLYLAVNAGTPAESGWGVPMATDIAFALGALALLGSRIPAGLKVFLTALAIVDDIAAVLVIALFYTASINTTALASAALVVCALIVANVLGARHPLVYIGLGALLWLAFAQSGVHATIAGVILAMTIPVRSRIDAIEFLGSGREMLDAFESEGGGHDVRSTSTQRAVVQSLETLCQHVETPLHRMEHALHPWVTYGILPLFAFANAGVRVVGHLADALTHPVSIGIVVGLVIGKQVGITSFAALAVRLRLANLPAGVTWQHIYGAAWLGGIGFTMALFIGALAFTDPRLVEVSKVGILVASLIAGIGGYTVLRLTTWPAPTAETGDS